MHILAAMALVGGTLYQRLAMPAAGKALSPETRDAWFQAARGPWSKVVMIATLLLLVSGLTNLVLTVRFFKFPNPTLPPYYHAVFGVKFLAAVLAGRSDGTRKFRENAERWLTVNLVLATTLVCLSGILRQTHTGPNIAPPAASVEPGNG
jgi:hypothetical protein